MTNEEVAGGGSAGWLAWIAGAGSMAMHDLTAIQSSYGCFGDTGTMMAGKKP
jgi:hypothetical protein